MLTSAGGILALLKDQNQVFHFKVRYFIKLNLLKHRVELGSFEVKVLKDGEETELW